MSKTYTFFSLLVAATPALAFQPFLTDDTGTQGADGNQLEFSHTKDRAHASDTTTTHTTALVFTRGIADTLDVFVQVNRTGVHSTETENSASGPGNRSLGAKWRFYEAPDEGLSLAIKPELFIPISAARENDGLGRGRTSHGATLVGTQEVSFGAVHVNLFAGRDRYVDSTANPDATVTRFSLAPVWDAAEGWKVGADLGSEATKAGGLRSRTGFTGIGMIHSPNKDLDFAVGLFHRSQVSGENRTKTNSLTAGVTWRF